MEVQISCVAKCSEIDLGFETAELPVIDFLEASKLLDVDVVSDQQSSESRFQFHPVVFRSFLICVFPLTPQKLLHVRS